VPVAPKALLATADSNMLRRKHARRAVVAPRRTGMGRIG
jgi:hypothetical protein